MAEGTVLVTGATGLVGTEVVAQLLSTTNSKIYVLVRAKTKEDAENRLRALWWGNDILVNAIGKRVDTIIGDITKPLEIKHIDITHVIHCAAETGVQKSRSELRNINIDGTRHVVRMAELLPQLKCFIHVSTAYVAGTQSGIILEEGPMATQFYSQYEQSKAEAEKIVRASTLPYIICRPGMIVGNSQTGHTRNFNTVYYVLKLILLGKLRVLPLSSKQTVNLIPVDYVAQQVVKLAFMPDAEGHTFHLTPPTDSLPQAGQLVEAVREWAKANLDIDVPKPIYLPVPMLRSIGKRYNARHRAKKRSLLSNLTALMPYFFDDHVFDRTNTDLFTGKYQLDWRSYLPKELEFACRHNFMRISDNSIFQQAMLRRKSRHYPITYYNITAKGTERITGHEMNTMVYGYANVLHEYGVKPGDKVALSGINCAEHTAIDNAIGLVGAVSVPIYYTTPADEIALLMNKSGVHLFFVGDERVMANVGDLPEHIKLIPFGPLNHESIHHPSPLTQYPSLSTQLATIRYTSGTTGEPKGVMFNFSQLKWMGEVLTNLLSWQHRNSEMRYLSFLPMSHVVEGILAAYAPYCMLCKAKIYYLTDFQMLTKAGTSHSIFLCAPILRKVVGTD